MIAASASELGILLSARAAGVWEVADGHLDLREFWPAPDLAPEVALAFARATTRVPIGQTGLGIVAAALQGHPRVSVAEELPEDSGSGLWLRRFGASHSFAVPIFHEQRVVGVVSCAIAEAGGRETDILLVIRDWLAGHPLEISPRRG